MPIARTPKITALNVPRSAKGVVLFGGTFDPPHRGHVELPRKLRDRVLGDGWWLVFVPAARSPHKAEGPSASVRHRLAMLRAATRGLPDRFIWTDEIDRAKHADEPSFWIDTLRRARRVLPRGTAIRFIIGSDQAVAFHRWKDFRKILTLAEPLVMVRPPHKDRRSVIRALRKLGAWNPAELEQWGTWTDDGRLFGLSSTGARALLSRRRASAFLKKWLTPDVRAYIARHKLYS